jgi:aminoglycoside 6-adenylyltransferase
MHPQYFETIEKLKTWSQQEQSIRGLLVLGSQVRDKFEGDEWSDLDLLLLADQPNVFMQSDTWLKVFGDVVCVIDEETFLDWVNLTWRVKRVLFADHRAVDFSILPSERVADVLAMNAEIHAHGYEVIYDVQPQILSGKIAETLANVKEDTPKIPTEAELQRIISQLLFQLIFAGKKIKRNELWVAVSIINQQVNHLLLQLIEFHTACVVQTSQGIRYDGRFLNSVSRRRCLRNYQSALPSMMSAMRSRPSLTCWRSPMLYQKR